MKVAKWRENVEVMNGEVLTYVCAEGQQKRVSISGISTAQAVLWAVQSDGLEHPVQVVNGLFDVDFMITEETSIMFETAGRVFVRDNAVTPLGEKTDGAEVFTTVMPRRAISPEVAEMMQVMRLNERRRDEQFQRELARVRAEQKRQAGGENVQRNEQGGNVEVVEEQNGETDPPSAE